MIDVCSSLLSAPLHRVRSNHLGALPLRRRRASSPEPSPCAWDPGRGPQGLPGATRPAVFIGAPSLLLMAILQAYGESSRVN